MWESDEQIDAEFDALWAVAFGDRVVPAKENTEFKQAFFRQFGEEAVEASDIYLLSRRDKYAHDPLRFGWRRKTEEELKNERS